MIKRLVDGKTTVQIQTRLIPKLMLFTGSVEMTISETLHKQKIVALLKQFAKFQILATRSLLPFSIIDTQKSDTISIVEVYVIFACS